MNYSAFFNAILGLWLLVSPATFGYKSSHMTISDMVCGGIVILLSLGHLRYAAFGWIIALCGLWLQFAPLLFWAPDAVAYLNDTLVGVLLLVTSLVLNGPPGVRATQGSAIPPGWSYNPSAYPCRVPILALNIGCWFIARYLAAFQLGYIDTIWDPFFGDGTIRVLTSTISKAFPVPDAGLGALAYTIEAIMGFGDPCRWRTTPWMVLLFGFLVVPVGCISILLIILQPTLVGHWCFLCIVTAFLMLMMIPFALDEVAAVFQLLLRARKQRHSLWKTFFQGEPGEEKAAQETLSLASMIRGVSLPWNLAFSTALGISGMFFGAYIPSALTVTVSIIACAEIARPVRYLLIPAGGWLALSQPLIGIPIILLSLRKGPLRETFSALKK